MYKLLLILHYLRSRRIAWVSLIAVTLCTAMVIVVISVMGGWLRMFKDSFHGITGDIVVTTPSQVGFDHYEQMIDEIKKLPAVAGVAPTLHTFGLIDIRSPAGGELQEGVQVIGLPLEQFNNISRFRQSLYRQYEQPDREAKNPATPADQRQAADAVLAAPASFKLPYDASRYKAVLPQAKTDISKWPGMIVGQTLVMQKNEKGETDRPPFLYECYARLTVLGSSPNQVSIDVNAKSERTYWIVDDSKTGVWQYDSQTVYVPFDRLQKDLRMDAQTYTDDATGQPATEPARTNDIRIGLKPGSDLAGTRDQVAKIVDNITHNKAIAFDLDEIRVQTWEQFNADYIGAVENEKILVVFLFGMISLVAVFLIFCIFYMIVVEKTRDIGIIKSVGATSTGVAGIFLGYGLAIGIVGSFLGLAVGYGIVHNINFLHTEMGKLLGIQIWNPKVYAFDIIPNTMNPTEVTIIMIVAVLSSVLGAIVPAIRAARLNPVEALRWE